MGELKIGSGRGHDSVVWDPTDEASTENARTVFEELVRPLGRGVARAQQRRTYARLLQRLRHARSGQGRAGQGVRPQRWHDPDHAADGWRLMALLARWARLGARAVTRYNTVVEDDTGVDQELPVAPESTYWRVDGLRARAESIVVADNTNTVMLPWPAQDAYRVELPRTQEDVAWRRESIEKARREREEAYDRAEALLLEHLDGEQAADWRDVRCFSVTAPSGRHYVIHDKESVNITRLNEDGSEEFRFCIVCDPEEALVPQPDLYLAQMLLLLTDEEAFERIAVRYEHENGSAFYNIGGRQGESQWHWYGTPVEGTGQVDLGEALMMAWSQT
jgi:hypothetical protein